MNDPLVSIETSSPADWRAGGAGLTLLAGYAGTPFGRALFAESPRGLCHLAFLDPWDEAEALADLQSRWPAANLRDDMKTAGSWGQRIFRTRRSKATKPLRLHLHGTGFQITVWRALLDIPRGSTTTYGQIAESIGHPGAHRATGTAVGRNPVAWLIPCHRVIRRSGALGNYRWGPDRKLAMLDWETLTPCLFSRATC